MRTICLPFVLLCLFTTLVHAQILFQSDFSKEEGFKVLEGDDNLFEFGYEYGDIEGIAEAPNSELLAGDEALGLRMESNISQGLPNELAVVTDQLEISGRYSVQVDVWLNYAIPHGMNGTTEFGGLSVGHDGVTPGRSGATLLYDTDGDSPSDYRLYRNKDLIPAGAEAYAVESLNNVSEPFVSAFPSVDVEQAAPNQFVFGTTAAGAGGFRWVTLEAIVDTDLVGDGPNRNPGLATFSLTDATTESQVVLGTIDNSGVDSPVDLSGDVGLVFADLFSSVSPASDLSFGLFDNLIITQLEPLLHPLDCNTDGALDADDLKCTTNVTDLDSLLTELKLVKGDFDADGNVAFSDFITLSLNFPKPVDNYTEGDTDLDGEVAFPDFIALSLNFGKTFPEAAAVPEPGTNCAWMLGLSMLLHVVRRRRLI